MNCILEGDLLRAICLEEWSDFAQFEEALKKPGPWIAGIDFPFGQSRTFIKNIGWPDHWAGYVKHAQALGREEFRNALETYRILRQKGDKEHRRTTDIAAASISPQKLHGIPVGLMFFEGAPRLLRSGVTIPLLLSGDPSRIVVEAYPGVLARHLIGRTGYKSDAVKNQTPEQRRKRDSMLDAILNGKLESIYHLGVEAPKELANDPTGDQLDALLCAIQAAWAWTMRDYDYGAPRGTDVLEGWIADASLRNNSEQR